MKFEFLKKTFLVSLCLHVGYLYSSSKAIQKTTNAVYTTEDVSLRFHAQWNVDEGTLQELHETYGIRRVEFDQKGHPILHGLSPAQLKRWKRLYNLCMSDGCYYCDSGEGSCELGTCGVDNEHCKPYLGSEGQPICGNVCSDYAFKSILICNDLS